MKRRPSVKPILPVDDLVEATMFYRALGFDVTAYDDDYAWVNHCGWELFHLRVVPGLEPGGAAAAAYVHVDDADGWRAALAATASEAEIGTVADMPWGMREFSFTDPSGNVIRIGENL
jgi:catechol 2,3-dioxygenase-like lactoylglutathione lyase family enzyme